MKKILTLSIMLLSSIYYLSANNWTNGSTSPEEITTVKCIKILIKITRNQIEAYDHEKWEKAIYIAEDCINTCKTCSDQHYCQNTVIQTINELWQLCDDKYGIHELTTVNISKSSSNFSPCSENNWTGGSPSHEEITTAKSIEIGVEIARNQIKDYDYEKWKNAVYIADNCINTCKTCSDKHYCQEAVIQTITNLWKFCGDEYGIHEFTTVSIGTPPKDNKESNS